MGVTPSKSWKELKVRGEQAERFLKRKKVERGQPAFNPQKQNFVPRGRGKAPASTVDANQTFQLQPPQQQQQQKQQKAPQQAQWQQRPQNQKISEPKFPKVYSFKEDEVPGLFKYLLENNKIKLPPIQDQEDAKRVNDPKYCAFHRAVHHPTRSCYGLKDKIQALIDVGVITPKPSKEKKVGANAVTISFGSVPLTWFQPEPVTKVEMKTVNDDPYGQSRKGLVSHTTTNGEILWVHPDLIEDEQWAGSSSKKKSKSKGKSCCGASAIPEGDDEEVPAFSFSEDEPEAFVINGKPTFATRSGNEYKFNYPSASDQLAEQGVAKTIPSKTLTELGVITTPSSPVEKTQQKQKVEKTQLKQKEKELLHQEIQIPKQSRFNRPIGRDKPGNSNTPYRFDIMTQLANIPARLTLYELLRLSKDTREALQEALANSDAFLTQIKPSPEEPEPTVQQCNLAAKQFPCITFTKEDMQTKNSRHDRPLYFTGHIGSSVVNRIQIDPGSAVSIMPLRLMYNLGIPASKLASTGTTIYGFNTSGSRPLGKIRIKCQIGDLRSEVTCYVIDAETSYNLLLGRPWIHSNVIVPSTLHQCLKYVDANNEVKTVVADKQPFKGLENYFTDSLLYGAESDTEPSVQGTDSGDEADTEAGPDYDGGFVLSDIVPIVINLDDEESSDNNCNWQLAEEVSMKNDLEYLLCFNDVMKELYENSKLHIPLRSSCVTKKHFQDAFGTTLVIPAKTEGEKEIIYGKGDMFPIPDHFLKENSNEDKLGLHLSKYSPEARQLMENQGYNFTLGEGLCFDRGPRTPPKAAYVPKGKSDDYYRFRRGLGYTSSSDDECCWLINNQLSKPNRDGQSSDSSDWDSDISLGEMFKGLMSNMTTIDLSIIEEDDQVPTWEDPWVHHLTMQYGDRFEQREPPTEDQIVQVNMGDEINPKPIFISDNLPPDEKEELITLIREYIDVFAWNYEDMPGLDPNIAMHRLNIKPDVKPIKQQQRRFRPQIMEAIETEIKKLIDSGFVREEQHPDWLANVVPVLKKNGKIRICIDFRDLNIACPKDDFPLPITDVIIDNTCGFERMSFMDGFSGYNQIKMHPEDEKHTAFRTPLGVFCYTVMPFGLKNAGATYQRAMSKIFQEHLRKTVECYVDNLVVKSCTKP